MTENSAFKREVRMYAREHGLKYTQARRQVLEAREQEPKAKILISSYQSICTACHLGADFHETHHDSLLGYSAKRGDKGCGARFVATTTDRMDITDEDLKRLRPDLPVDHLEEI